MLHRISCKLDGWKKTFLSLGSRITLMQSCLSLITPYFLLIFKVSMKVTSKLKKLQRDFLLSGFRQRKRDHLIKWDLVYKLKREGLG